MFARVLSLALLAAERSAMAALPQRMEPPLLSGTDTGSRSQIRPASRITALTAMIDRRAVIYGLPSDSGGYGVNQDAHYLNPGSTYQVLGDGGQVVHSGVPAATEAFLLTQPQRTTVAVDYRPKPMPAEWKPLLDAYLLTLAARPGKAKPL